MIDILKGFKSCDEASDKILTEKDINHINELKWNSLKGNTNHMMNQNDTNSLKGNTNRMKN